MRCPHCGIHYMDGDSVCPICGKSAGRPAKRKEKVTYTTTTPRTKTPHEHIPKTSYTKKQAKPRRKRFPIFTILIVLIILNTVFQFAFSNSFAKPVDFSSPSAFVNGLADCFRSAFGDSDSDYTYGDYNYDYDEVYLYTQMLTGTWSCDDNDTVLYFNGDYIAQAEYGEHTSTGVYSSLLSDNDLIYETYADEYPPDEYVYYDTSFYLDDDFDSDDNYVELLLFVPSDWDADSTPPTKGDTMHAVFLTSATSEGEEFDLTMTSYESEY